MQKTDGKWQIFAKDLAQEWVEYPFLAMSANAQCERTLRCKIFQEILSEIRMHLRNTLWIESNKCITLYPPNFRYLIWWMCYFPMLGTSFLQLKLSSLNNKLAACLMAKMIYVITVISWKKRDIRGCINDQISQNVIHNISCKVIHNDSHKMLSLMSCKMSLNCTRMAYINTIINHINN